MARGSSTPKASSGEEGSKMTSVEVMVVNRILEGSNFPVLTANATLEGPTLYGSEVLVRS